MRVYSKHETVNITVDGENHRVVFLPESPGIYVTEVEVPLGEKLLTVGESGGFWSHDVPVEPQAHTVEHAEPEESPEEQSEPEEQVEPQDSTETKRRRKK